MTSIELLTISDYFQLPKIGLVLAPDFALPKTGWSNFGSEVVVERPDGSQLPTTAKFSQTHFLIKDPSVPIDKRWRITVSLPGLTKRNVPIGSKILVTPATAARVLPGAA